MGSFGHQPERPGGAVAALDIRDYVSIAALRRDLCRVVSDFCAAFPHLRTIRAGTLLLLRKRGSHRAPGRKARTLDEFREGLAHLSHAGFYFHFISSRLRLKLQTNDFSHWLADGLGLATLADSVNHGDIYTNTLDSSRAKLLRLIRRERRESMSETLALARIPLDDYAELLEQARSRSCAPGEALAWPQN